MSGDRVVTYPPEVWIPLTVILAFGWLRPVIGPMPTPRTMTLSLVAYAAPLGGILLGVDTLPRLLIFTGLVVFCVFCGMELEKGKRKEKP